MALTQLVIGENSLITRNLKQADGTTDLDISDIATITAELIQDGDTKKTWTYEADGDEWSTGFQQSGATQVQIELEVATSEALDPGVASMRWIIAVTNPEFFVSGLQTSITDEEVFDVVESELDE